MKRKILLAILVGLLLLPATGFTGDVEVTHASVEWIKETGFFCRFRAEIKVANYDERDHTVGVKLAFYDQDGFVIRRVYFSGRVRANESRIFNGQRTVLCKTYEAIDYYDVTVR